YELKVKAVADDAELIGGVWWKRNSKDKLVEIGKQIWGDFAVIKERFYDSATDNVDVQASLLSTRSKLIKTNKLPPLMQAK
ncbi:MAG: hypothetical protein HRU20_28985, partial [Pseudomonadales bacterium]|nr:hypothetical protein [Pseudomonadales bacterium]